MSSKQDFEQAAQSIAKLNRQQVTHRIKHFKSRFKLDFTDEYLNKLSVDRLKHILLAAVINSKN